MSVHITNPSSVHTSRGITAPQTISLCLFGSLFFYILQLFVVYLILCLKNVFIVLCLVYGLIITCESSY